MLLSFFLRLFRRMSSAVRVPISGPRVSPPRRPRPGRRRGDRAGAPRAPAARRTSRRPAAGPPARSGRSGMRPTFSERTRPLDSRTARCWTTAESVISRGRARSLTVAGPRTRCSTMLRRVGSPSARNTSSTGGCCLSIHLSISGCHGGVKGSLQNRAWATPVGRPMRGRRLLGPRQPQHVGHAVVPAGRVPAVDRQRMAR